MGDRSLSHPQRNAAIRQRLFEIVNNQRRLLGPVDVQLGTLSPRLDLELCPLPRHKVDIGLVLAWTLPAQLIPWKSWNRNVLRRMVAL
jgi:hypothetical protein